MGSSSERLLAPESQLISRRTLVRAGATAAWTVPLVQVVAAAPALAASGDTTLALAVPTGNYTSATVLHVTASVTNSGTKATQNLQLTLTLPTPASGTVTATGWTVTGSGSTFTFTANAPVIAGASLGFDVTFTVSATPAGSVGVVATATNAPTQSKSGGVDGYTASTTLQWASAISGVYVTTNANLLDVTTSVKNSGSVPATDFQIQVTLPFSSTGVASVSPGWTATGSGSVWTVTRSTALGAGATGGFTARFDVGTYTGGSLGGKASASNVASAVNSVGTITAAGLSNISMKDAGGTGLPSVTPLVTSGNAKTWRLQASVLNSGPRTVSNMSMTVDLGRAMSLSSNNSNGWSTSQTGSQKVWTFTRTDTTAPATPTGNLDIVVSDNGQTPTVTYHVTATNATSI